jgi:phage tail sheath gpL-like
MSISFNHIPANVRTPLFYAEMDNSQANPFTLIMQALLLGQKCSGGTATTNTPYIVGNEAQAVTLFGRGSMLHRMFKQFRANNPMMELWAIAMPDPSTTKSTGTIVFTGPATANGTVSLYIAGQAVPTNVAKADTASEIAAAVAASINAAYDLPVSATVSTNTVTLHCLWGGTSGDDIAVSLNYNGLVAGEKLPAGVGATITAMDGGAGIPAPAGAIAALGDESYEFIIHPYADTGTMDALDTELDDESGRWSYARQVYGHAYTALRGSLSDLVTHGDARNGQHHTCFGFEADIQQPVWEVVAAAAGRQSAYLAADVARPTQTGPLVGITPPRAGQRFMRSERESLLNHGIATLYAENGTVRIERGITNYRENAYGQTDVSYLDAETLHTSAYVLRRLKTDITSKYGRCKLANDGTKFGAGQAIVTPNVIRGELLASYKDMEFNGIVENFEQFARHLIVERDGTDPNRVNVLYPPDYVNQLRVFAVLNQFRLQYPAVV